MLPFQYLHPRLNVLTLRLAEALPLEEAMPYYQANCRHVPAGRRDLLARLLERVPPDTAPGDGVDRWIANLSLVADYDGKLRHPQTQAPLQYPQWLHDLRTDGRAEWERNLRQGIARDAQVRWSPPTAVELDRRGNFQWR
ncbi:hypothetical protein [Ramlibacter albus]|uniref:Uncharacterized protein n=1 Tax=Ramlibacter albus TaxID=2079448 RepID=A0A923S3F8_9BURK|nr:hypothetical protein [Ramlibacter albus]MBC5766504.1 hypothetical protein [Ramlibacter albus]